MKTFIFILFLLVVLPTRLKSEIPDSLEIALKHVHDSVKCRILNQLIEDEADDHIWPAYNEKLQNICESNLKKIPGISDKKTKALRHLYIKYLASAFNNQGYLFNIQGRTGEAKEYFKKSILLQEEINDQKGMAESLNNLGVIYQYQSDIPEALECYHRSLKIQEQIGDKSGIASSLNNIGAIYQNQNSLQNALNYFTKSLKIQEEINDKIGLAYTLNNIGRIYDSKNDLNASFNFHNKSLQVRREINDLSGIANSLNNIGALYQKKSSLAGDNQFQKDTLLSKALSFHLEALEKQRTISDKKGIAYSLNSIASIQFDTGKITEAVSNAQKSLEISRELGYPISISNASYLLSKIYVKQGDFKLAYEMQALYKQMSDSLNNETNRKASIQKSLQYEYQKKSIADSIRTMEERKIFTIQIKQEKTQRMALYAVIGLTGIFGIFMFNRLRITRKQKNIIELQKREVDSQRQLADERRKIAETQKHIIEEKQKEILDSIHYARRIQHAMLTSEEYIKNHLGPDCFIIYQPKDIVSGDFYWALWHHQKFYIATADCTGHGVPGAFMSLLNISFLNENVIERNISNPAKILNEQRREIIKALNPTGTENSKDGMDCVLCAFDLENGMLEFAAANNPLWLLRNNSIITFKADKMPVGKYHEDARDFSDQSILLEKGDIVYTFTDGCTDQFGGPKGKKFMFKQLEQLLLSIQHLSMTEQKEHITATLEAWKGHLDQVDDITIIGIKI